jgi:putative intracellular protease/amidase
MCISGRREFLRHSLLAATAIGFGVGLPDAATAQSAPAAAKYICPPCGCSMDGVEFDKPGNCSACGMQLIAKPVNAPPQAKIAIFVFPGVQIIDFTAPYEVFGQAGYHVYTVAQSREPMLTNMNMKIIPDYSFDDMPEPHVLLVPGGNIGNLRNSQDAVASWIRATSAKAKHTMSVCNGAFILAQAGLLDGRTATANYGGIDSLRSGFPRVTVVSDRRFVDSGVVSTTAGLSSGIDGALYLVSKISGVGAAQMVALGIEYDWRPDANYARASLGDIHLHKVFGRRLQLDVPGGLAQQVIATQGDQRSWETIWHVGTVGKMEALTAQSMTESIDAAVRNRGQWSRSANGGDPNVQWKFSDARAKSWTAKLQVDTVAAEGPLRVRLALRQVT